MTWWRFRLKHQLWIKGTLVVVRTVLTASSIFVTFVRALTTHGQSADACVREHARLWIPCRYTLLPHHTPARSWIHYYWLAVACPLSIARTAPMLLKHTQSVCVLKLPSCLPLTTTAVRLSNQMGVMGWCVHGFYPQYEKWRNFFTWVGQIDNKGTLVTD